MANLMTLSEFEAQQTAKAARRKRPVKLKKEIKEEIAILKSQDAVHKMNDNKLNNTFFTEAGIRQENTKRCFLTLPRKNREDALKLLRDKRERSDIFQQFPPDPKDKNLIVISL